MSMNVAELKRVLDNVDEEMFISIAFIEDTPMGFEKSVEIADSIEIFPEEGTICINSKSLNTMGK